MAELLVFETPPMHGDMGVLEMRVRCWCPAILVRGCRDGPRSKKCQYRPVDLELDYCFVQRLRRKGGFGESATMRPRSEVHICLQKTARLERRVLVGYE